MHGKMQESGLTGIVPLICTSAPWGQDPVLSLLSALRGHRLQGALQGLRAWQWASSGLTVRAAVMADGLMAAASFVY